MLHVQQWHAYAYARMIIYSTGYLQPIIHSQLLQSLKINFHLTATRLAERLIFWKS